MRTILVFWYGAPDAYYLFRFPAPGLRWQTAMRAIQRAIKRIESIPRNQPAPRWDVENGDDVNWDSSNAARFVYNVESGEFEHV